MNTPELEERLRTQMRAKADELRLPPLEFGDVLDAAHPVAHLSIPRAPASRRGSTWMVAAALVVGATIGAGAIALTRDESASTDQNEVRFTPPVQAPGGEGGLFGGCPEAEVPDDVASMELPNDLRLANALLPETPERYCVSDHQVSSTIGPGGVESRVWSSCTSCERPTASVAAVRTQSSAEVYEALGAAAAEVVDVHGSPALFYPADDVTPVARLYTKNGAAGHLAFVGWGLDESALVDIANAVTSSDAPEIDGMELVFDGYLDPYWPGHIPFGSILSVGYTSTSGDAALGYSVWEYVDQIPLEAYAWARPNPVLTSTDGQRSITFPASASFGETDQTTVITQIDENTTVMWTSNGTPPMTADELAAIELTPAAPDDPRWDEIAYESGGYNNQG